VPGVADTNIPLGNADGRPKRPRGWMQAVVCRGQLTCSYVSYLRASSAMSARSPSAMVQPLVFLRCDEPSQFRGRFVDSRARAVEARSHAEVAGRAEEVQDQGCSAEEEEGEREAADDAVAHRRRALEGEGHRPQQLRRARLIGRCGPGRKGVWRERQSVWSATAAARCLAEQTALVCSAKQRAAAADSLMRPQRSTVMPLLRTSCTRRTACSRCLQSFDGMRGSGHA